MQDMTKQETSALARYFVGRVEKARDALSACKLSQYADEVCIMLPRTAPEFERFVYWAEAMLDTFTRWTALAEVHQTHDTAALNEAKLALDTLAKDARALLTRYQARTRGEV